MEGVPKQDAGSPKNTRNFLEASGSSSMEASRRPEGSSSSSSRGNGHPFKRCTVTNNGIHENGSHKGLYSKKGDWVRLVLKSRELTSKANRTSIIDKGPRSSNRAWFYGIAIIAAVCYLVAEAFVQGSISLLSKGTAVVASEALTLNRIYKRSGKLLSTEEALEYKVQFIPWKLKEHFMKQRSTLDELRKLQRSSFRRPRLALVCANLESTPESLYLITLWKAIEVLGYDLEIFSLKDGPMHSAWEQTGAFVTTLHLDLANDGLGIDWSKFEGVMLSSLDMKPALASFMQDPFKEVPVIWILHEETQGKSIKAYGSPVQKDLLSNCKRTFERADVVLFSDHVLAMEYSLLDSGNFFVLPGSPTCVWEAEQYMSTHTREEVRGALNLRSHDIAIAVVGSPFSYKGVWREHAIVMQAILPLARDIQNSRTDSFSLKLFFLSGGFSSGYNTALQILAARIGLANGTVSHFGGDRDAEELLWGADVIVYSSLREEQAFPSTLIKAMVFEHPIIVPNITVVRNHMQDGIHGIIFRAGDRRGLTQAFESTISQSGVTDLALATASYCRVHAHGLLVANIISGFADLLESVIQFPSEAYLPLPVSNVPENLKKDWQWQLLEVSHNFSKGQRLWRSSNVAHENEKQMRKALAAESKKNDVLSLADWAEVKLLQLAEEMERSEEEQLNERNEQLHGSWEEVYRSVRRTENMKNDLHEREDGELERTGQPICIYEPYFGAGTWPLLGQKSTMYRGISLIPRQRRAGSDDIEASLRLPLLNHSYYQDVLCEFGAFLAIANHIDRIHKNAWIGFQSWQAAGRKVSLSGKAEMMIYDVVKRGNNRDTIYFWASTDPISLNDNQRFNHRDFWLYCDAINNGNCRDAFLRAFKQMFGLPSSWKTLPPMPLDGDRWSALHSWAMPTPSFMEFIMFSRMFVSALDLELLEHHAKGKCSLGSSRFEVRHCYCRLLELLINVWAYHSGRRMVFVDPYTGSMHEQHQLSLRHGRMWINFFSYNTLKGMDEDLAEEIDDGMSNRRWLWPHTGEVFCQRIHERERRQRYAMKLEKKKRDKERVRRIRSRQRQRPLARG